MRGRANEKSGAYEELPICHHHSEFPPILPPPPPNPHQWSFQFDKLQFISWIWPVTLPPPSFAMESEIKQTTRGRKSGVVRTSALVQISLQLVGGNCHFYCTAAPVCPINWKHFLYQITWIGERTEITGIDYKRRHDDDDALHVVNSQTVFYAPILYILLMLAMNKGTSISTLTVIQSPGLSSTSDVDAKS